MDISHNQLTTRDLLDILSVTIPQIKCLYIQGNPASFESSIKVLECFPNLVYFNNAPIRRCLPMCTRTGIISPNRAAVITQRRKNIINKLDATLQITENQVEATVL